MNTRGVQFMNKNGFDPSTLSFGYWDDMVSLRFNPALDPSKQTEKSVFDYNTTISTALTMEKLMNLLYKVDKVIMPAIMNNEEKSIGIQLAGNSLLVLSTGVKRFNTVKPYIGLHKSINPSTRIPETSIYYEFKTGESVDDYNDSDGSCNYTNDIPTEFLLFIELIKASIIGLSHSVTHSMRYVNKYKNDKIENAIIGIAEKNGVSVPGSKGGYNNVNWKSSSQTAQTDDVDVEDVTNLDDLLN
jgi:hypothetical protein